MNVSVHPAPFWRRGARVCNGWTWIATSMSTPMRRTNTNQFIRGPSGAARWSAGWRAPSLVRRLQGPSGRGVSGAGREYLGVGAHAGYHAVAAVRWRRAAALRAEKIERQAPAEPRAAKTRRVEIEIGRAVVRVSADIAEPTFAVCCARCVRHDPGRRAGAVAGGGGGFRKGPEGLVSLVRDAGADPFDGSLYVFRANEPIE